MGTIKDVINIINQALGKKNIFGYKTTLANQLQLIFCGWGNIYYTDALCKSTKYLWFCWLHSTTLIVVITTALYAIFGRHSGDILLPIYLGFTIASTTLFSIIKPVAAMFQYKDDIDKLILAIDKLLVKKSKRYNIDTNGTSNQTFHTKKLVLTLVLASWIPLIPYTFMPMLDMVLFYDEEKAKNFLYYMVPLSGLEHYGSFKFYKIFNLISMCSISLFFLVYITFLIFCVIWVAICGNETQRIVDLLNSLDSVRVQSDDMESRFREVIKKTIYSITHLTRIISYFRGFFQTMASVTLPLLLYIEIAHALIFISPKFPFMVKAKELGAFITTIEYVYVLCWVGAKLEEMTSELSFAVYSTPWYWLKNIRKDVHILLCQTQTPVKPVALNVYPLTLTTFLRYCNVINSMMNVFRAHTFKK